MATGVGAAAVGSTVGSVYMGVQARKEGKEAAAVQAAEQDVQRRDSARQQVRQERIRRAQLLSSAQQSGVSGSSSEAGSLGSMRTQSGAQAAQGSGAMTSQNAVVNSQKKMQDFELATQVINTGTSLFSAWASGKG